MADAMYERFAAAYAEHAEHSPYNAYYDRPAVLSLAGDVKDQTVLDAGCGPGLYASELVKRGARVIGFDQSRAMVALARQRVGPRAELRVHDLNAPLDWLNDGAVDLVIAALTINYVDDRVRALAEFRRVLKPSGAVIVSTTHPTSDWLRLGGSYFAVEPVEESLRPGHDWPVRAWRRPLTVVCDEFRHAGFLIEQLVEPRPVKEMSERYPADFAELERAPAFLAVRLVPKCADSDASLP